ncbi:MAG: hypothetical protein BMS9Abin07_0361 [Acidimicrobiia bacterium]|nr:MAG: hypothetical protein BMS9Abin07_0361 [Acidimicrobiia bacterium]
MIHRLSLANRDRTHLKSIMTVVAGSAIRIMATFGIAVAALVPVGPTPALAVVSCPAGAISWTGAVGGNWSDASKWTGGVMPTSADDACIPAGATVTVDIPAAAVDRLISEGTLSIGPLNKLTIGGTSRTADFSLEGTLAGPGSLTISGSASWTQGTMATSLVIATGASLDIGTATTKILTGSLTNWGTVTQPGSQLKLGTVTNHGMWYLTNPFTATIRKATIAPKFTNYGTVERSASATGVLTDMTKDIAFENYGTISVTTGILQIAGTTAIGDGAGMNAGSGALLIMSANNGGPATATGTSTITGLGTVEWRSGTFTVDAAAVIDARDALLLQGATIAGPGKLSISGPASWTMGTISGSAEVTTSGILDIAPSSAGANVTGSLVNYGMVTQPGQNLYVSRSGVAGEITNEGTWRFTNTASKSSMIRGETGNPGSFVNNGILEGSDGLTSTRFTVLESTVNLRNNGTVVARSGQLWIWSAPSHYAGTTFSTGTWEARGGSKLAFPSAFTENGANLVLSGAGSSFGYLAGTFDVRTLGAFTTNTGTFQLAEGADFTTGAGFANTGTLVLGNASAVGDASTLAVNGAFTTTGTVEIQVGGTPGDRLYGEVTTTGTATLGGTLRASLLNGFTPAPGDAYKVMYPSVSGTFGSLDIAPYFEHTVTGTAVYLNGIDPVPVADAGGPYTTDEGSNVVLDGTGSFDLGTGSIISYNWQPAASFANNTMVKPTFTNTIDNGTFAVTLEVCDDATDGSQCNTDSATVTVNNVAPVVTAISGPLTLDEGQAMTLTALATFSDVGFSDTHTATIDWGDGDSEPAGTSSTVSGAHTYIQDGPYTITVTVTDDDGGSGAATIGVTVTNVSPTVSITETSVTGTVGDTITITGTYADQGSADTHTADIDWKDGSSDLGVPVTGNAFSFDHVYTSEGTRTVQVCVADGDGGSGCDTVVVQIDPVLNMAPIVDAGGDFATDEGAPTAISGTASDPDGDPFTTAWTSTPGGSFAAAGSLATTFTAAEDGTYTITLTATDSPGGLSASDTATVTVRNVAPTIGSLRVDSGIPEGATASLDATFSDPGALDTHTATIDWDEGGGAVPATVTGYAVTGSNLYESAGTYTVRLCVTDDDGGTGCRSATVEVTATPGGNTPPTSDPGGPYRRREGKPLRLDGSGSSDPDGTIVSYRWTASGGSFDDPTSKTPMYTAPDDGIYELTLVVTDDGGLSDSRTTRLVAINAEPHVTAGRDVEIAVGDKYRLKAKFHDRGILDTHTATIDWGDGSDVTVIDPATSPFRRNHRYDGPGRYTITVTVVDDDGGVGSDTLTVAATSDGIAPVADAGGPYRGREGSKIRLNGRRSSDPDGRIVTYRWTATGGSFDNPNKSRPKFRAPNNGTYIVTLEVTDNDGLTDSATTTVTVRNVDPRVDAGRDAKIRAGDEFRLKAKFDDPGRNDTHTATIDWGDGSDVTVIDSATSPIRLEHEYAEASRYTVTVTVVDDDGGSGSDRLEVTVKRADRDDDDRDKRRHDDDDDDDGDSDDDGDDDSDDD